MYILACGHVPTHLGQKNAHFGSKLPQNIFNAFLNTYCNSVRIWMNISRTNGPTSVVGKCGLKKPILPQVWMFWSQSASKMAGIAQYRPIYRLKHPSWPEVLPKSLFYPKTKNSWKNSGDKIIKCLLTRESLTVLWKISQRIVIAQHIFFFYKILHPMLTYQNLLIRGPRTCPRTSAWTSLPSAITLLPLILTFNWMKNLEN